MEVVCLVRSVGTAKHLVHLLTAPSPRVSLSNSAPVELREMGNKQRGQLYREGRTQWLGEGRCGLGGQRRLPGSNDLGCEV